MKRHFIAMAFRRSGRRRSGDRHRRAGRQYDPLTHQPLVQNPNTFGADGRPLATAIPRETVYFLAITRLARSSSRRPSAASTTCCRAGRP